MQLTFLNLLSKLISREYIQRWLKNSVKKFINRPRGNDVFAGNWMCVECSQKTKNNHSGKNIEIRTTVVSVEASTEPIALNSKHVLQPVWNQDEIIHEKTSDDILTSPTGILTR